MEVINLNFIPSGANPVAHASQFDEGRTTRFNLFDGSAVYTLDGTEIITVSVRKPDGHIVTESVTNTSSTYVEVVTTEQMTACAGDNLAQIKVEKGGDTIGFLNYILSVQKDPEDGGDPSASFIHDLTQQIADAVAEQYDSNAVIFDAVPTAGHGNGYTVTSEGIKDALDAINNPAASAVSYDNTASGLTATNVQDAIDEVDGDVGDLSTLTTTANSDLVSAVNEVDGDIGDLTTLTTTDKSSIVGAVNEVNKYKAGDTVTLDGVIVGGSLGSSKLQFDCTIPLPKSCEGLTATISTLGAALINNGTYQSITNVSKTITVSTNAVGISINVTFTSAPSASFMDNAPTTMRIFTSSVSFT